MLKGTTTRMLPLLLSGLSKSYVDLTRLLIAQGPGWTFDGCRGDAAVVQLTGQSVGGVGSWRIFLVFASIAG